MTLGEMIAERTCRFPDGCRRGALKDMAYCADHLPSWSAGKPLWVTSSWVRRAQEHGLPAKEIR